MNAEDRILAALSEAALRALATAIDAGWITSVSLRQGRVSAAAGGWVEFRRG